MIDRTERNNTYLQRCGHVLDACVVVNERPNAHERAINQLRCRVGGGEEIDDPGEALSLH
jgi:hypothetical protein